MAHWIIEDKGFGGVVYKCSSCGELWNEYYQSFPKDHCAFCGEDIDDDAVEYVEEKKKMEKFFIPNDYILDKYESPIKMFATQLATEYENGILKAVQAYYPDIDKDELYRALKNDRDQYDKGYADGLRDMKEKMMKAFHFALSGKIIEYMNNHIDDILSDLEE